MEIIHKLIIDRLIELIDLPILFRNSRDGAVFTVIVRAKIRIFPLTKPARVLAGLKGFPDEVLKVFQAVFF